MVRLGGFSHPPGSCMRLNRLEIAGFKSFPDRSELAFDQGVTAIVGPNGCGKSNVVDAISWVLGEQSHKSLRAERMADCIFNGTVKRPPMGLAEVTITMEDPELAEAARFVLEGGTDAAANGNPTVLMAPVDETSASIAAVEGGATPMLVADSEAGGGPEGVDGVSGETSGGMTDA